MPYNIKIDIFEGPFDLLLHLVRVNEMDIYDIPIARITDQYLQYIKEMEKLDLRIAGEFLVMAATLINLKSRTLMPPLREEDEEEEEVEDEYSDIRSAQDLMRQLIEYRQFKEMASRLAEREQAQLRLFYRNSVLPVLADGAQSPEVKEDVSLLFSAFARVLEYVESRPSHHVLEEEFSVEEKIEAIRRQLEQSERLNIDDLLRRCVNKNEIITVFLALLEVCRLRLARIRQKGNFGEIYLTRPGTTDEEEDE